MSDGPGPLSNARHERFAQGLAEGKSASAAYIGAGYSANDGNAIRLKGNERIASRVAELLKAAEGGYELVETTKRRLIAAIYEKALAALPGLLVETAQEVKALIEPALAIDKDARVVAGGVSDRTEKRSDGLADRLREIDEVMRGSGRSVREGSDSDEAGVGRPAGSRPH